jgi:hypothetical protein
MCKARIEKAAKQAGATQAAWNMETHILNVSFAPQKTTLESIEQRVSEVGHDTEHFTAPVEVYKALHGCCQYERKAQSPASAKIAMTDCCGGDCVPGQCAMKDSAKSCCVPANGACSSTAACYAKS